MEESDHDNSSLLLEEEPNETLSTIFDEDGSFCNSFSSLGARDLVCDGLILNDNPDDEKHQRFVSKPRQNLGNEGKSLSLRENGGELCDFDRNEAPLFDRTPKRLRIDSDIYEENSLRLQFSPSLKSETETIITHSSARGSDGEISDLNELDAPLFNGTPNKKSSRIGSNEYEENSFHLHFTPSLESETETFINHSISSAKLSELSDIDQNDEALVFNGTPKRSSRIDPDEHEENSFHLHFSPSLKSETETFSTHSSPTKLSELISDIDQNDEAIVFNGTPKRSSRIDSDEYEENSFHLHFSPSLKSETETFTHSSPAKLSELISDIDQNDEAIVFNGTPKRSSRIDSDEYEENSFHLHFSPSLETDIETFITHSSECTKRGSIGELSDTDKSATVFFGGTTSSIILDKKKQISLGMDRSQECLSNNDIGKNENSPCLNGVPRISRNNSIDNDIREDYLSLSPSTSSNFETDTANDESQDDTIRGNYRYSGNRQKSDQYVKDLFHAHQNAGCPDQCLKPFSLQDIQYCRKELSDMTTQEVKHFVMNALRNQTSLKKKANKTCLQANLMIFGKKTCSRCWCIVYGISDWRFRDSVARMKAGKTSCYRMKTRAAGLKREKTTTALAWMSTLFRRMGDYMPHRETIHLPHSWSKKYLYERMVSELLQVDFPRKGNVISYEHFTRIWKANLSQYVISKTSDFTKCSMCTQLSDQYEKAKSHEGRANIARLKAEHDGQVERERKAYHDARLSARQDPSQMTCIIVDGMDQSKTSIPHFVVEDKDNAHLAKLPVHFTGVLVHTASPEGKIPFIYHDIKHVPHDSNLTIHCITETLCELKDRLGKALFLQMDNCGRENKNKYVLSYISLLVHLDIFKEAFVHFLPVGHTHEDIDQMFSCVARQLRCNNAFTMTDLEERSSHSYCPHIKMVPVTMVQEVKEELLDHMAGNFTNHSRPLWFRFRQMEGNTYMHYKLHVNDSWKPAAESEWHMGLECLKSYPDISTKLKWVETSLAKTDFDKLCQEVPHAYNARLSADARQWWIDFLSTKIKPTYEDIPSTKRWTLHQLLDQEKAPDIEETDVENVQCLQSCIMRECPEVFIGPQGKVQRGVKRVADFSSLNIGMLAAVHCEEINGRPHIATITEMAGEGVTVSWMKGSWTGSWHPWILRQKGQCKPYSSNVPKNSIILWDFTFTKGSRLRQETVRELKSKYAELDAERNFSEFSK